jgi:ABC-type uncharacterized transport system auxiliary subunit
MTRLSRWSAHAALAGLVVLLAACFGGGTPVDNFYRLTVPAPPALAVPPLDGAVEVRRPVALGMTGERALLVSDRVAPEQVKRRPYDFWTEPPPVMVQDALVTFLRRAKAAPLVVTSEFRVPAEYRIEGRLRRFEQIAGAAPTVVVEMDLGLVRTGHNDLLHLATYQAEEPVAGTAAADAVPAYQAALTRVFGLFLTDLEARRP